MYDRDGQEIAKQITIDALADLDGYLLGIRNWMTAAQSCMKAMR